jgi:hypothetical protein
MASKGQQQVIDAIVNLRGRVADLPSRQWERATLLPMETNQGTGERRLAWPQFVVDAANAAMAPGRAVRGEYDLMVDPNTGENYYAGMAGDVANLAGLVTVGAGAIPAEAGALRMGMKFDQPPEAFPIRPSEPFQYMHNNESASKFGPAEAFANDPYGYWMVHGEGGKAPDDRWVTGQKQFDQPLYIEWDGWKERLSSAYGGATGKELTKKLRADGYDGIVTFDKYGPSEMVALK